jgi:RNA polymerase sigma-70 factor (ECF subfamily)
MSNDASGKTSVREELIALIPRLRRFGYALTNSREDADDIAQITLERALNNIHQWKPGTRLDSWLFRIAQNAWIDEMRARKRRGPSVEIDEATTLTGEDGRDAAHARLDLAEARQAIAGLPDEQRIVMALVAIEGLSYQEAASAIGVPIGTVMSRLARARAAVAQHLARKRSDA